MNNHKATSFNLTNLTHDGLINELIELKKGKYLLLEVAPNLASNAISLINDRKRIIFTYFTNELAHSKNLSSLDKLIDSRIYFKINKRFDTGNWKLTVSNNTDFKSAQKLEKLKE